ncbi:MAG: hypothetical protein HY231_04725 [Acidobacteria bacterium]|nr:hypothetical protein [Acidobacteriota bacterium]
MSGGYRRRSSEEIRRKRILAGFPGFIIGLLFGALVSYSLKGTYISRITFAGCIAGIAAALAICEKMFALPSEGDYHAANWEEAMNPLGITSKATETDGKDEAKAEGNSRRI